MGQDGVSPLPSMWSITRWLINIIWYWQKMDYIVYDPGTHIHHFLNKMMDPLLAQAKLFLDKNSNQYSTDFNVTIKYILNQVTFQHYNQQLKIDSIGCGGSKALKTMEGVISRCPLSAIWPSNVCNSPLPRKAVFANTNTRHRVMAATVVMVASTSTNKPIAGKRATPGVRNTRPLLLPWQSPSSTPMWWLFNCVQCLVRMMLQWLLLMGRGVQMQRIPHS